VLALSALMLADRSGPGYARPYMSGPWRLTLCSVTTLIHRSLWKGNSANFAFWKFSEVCIQK
jgi:hypothetical protein